MAAIDLETLRRMARLGVVVDEVSLDHIGHVQGGGFAVVATEALAYHAEWLRTRVEEYGADVRERLRMGAFVSGPQYVRGQQVRGLVRAEVDRALAAHDVLLAPTTPIVATPGLLRAMRLHHRRVADRHAGRRWVPAAHRLAPAPSARGMTGTRFREGS